MTAVQLTVGTRAAAEAAAMNIRTEIHAKSTTAAAVLAVGGLPPPPGP